ARGPGPAVGRSRNARVATLSPATALSALRRARRAGGVSPPSERIPFRRVRAHSGGSRPPLAGVSAFPPVGFHDAPRRLPSGRNRPRGGARRAVVTAPEPRRTPARRVVDDAVRSDRPADLDVRGGRHRDGRQWGRQLPP